ncbi:reverse transcriptase [Plakobranchus ocellatus]|uniref:Reverse transcriptase n=1 Tax=Plakobranchus ocellatus TaxID=259542 RepID=A0AAV4ABZ5_9GAST|nr:reverse transcriptase [Plakobranchus ocellatus]
MVQKEFKPKKSRSLLIRKGKVDEATTFTVAEQQIPTISQEPVKSLGRCQVTQMLVESDDPEVKTVQPSLKTGRKWKVTEAVDEAN